MGGCGGAPEPVPSVTQHQDAGGHMGSEFRGGSGPVTARLDLIPASGAAVFTPTGNWGASGVVF